jgi:hypothetical protein
MVGSRNVGEHADTNLVGVQEYPALSETPFGPENAIQFT